MESFHVVPDLAIFFLLYLLGCWLLRSTDTERTSVACGGAAHPMKTSDCHTDVGNSDSFKRIYSKWIERHSPKDAKILQCEEWATLIGVVRQGGKWYSVLTWLLLV